MSKRLQRFLTALKEKGCVSYAKIATAGGFCSVDLIVVKATSPDDGTIPEHYVNELLKIFSISPSSFRAFSLSFIARFRRTRCWRVALKCLHLVHILLRSLPGDSPLRTELLWARTNGLVSFFPCHFQDSSSFYSDEHTVFIRSYAWFIDEALNIVSIDGNASICHEEAEVDDGKENKTPESLSEKMKCIGQILELLSELQRLIDRVVDCRPIGPVENSFIVHSVMQYIVCDSLICYTTVRREFDVLLGKVFQMPYRSCVTTFDIYKKAALQANQLNKFYEWCKSKGLCGSYDFPFIDGIPPMQIQALETLVNDMWQLTESSSSDTSPSSLVPSWSSFTEDDGDKIASGKEIIVSEQLEEVEENQVVIKYMEEEAEPLIQSNDKWETLLDASLNLSPACKISDSMMLYPEEPFIGSRHSLEPQWLKNDPAAALFNPFYHQYAHGGSLIKM